MKGGWKRRDISELKKGEGERLLEKTREKKL